RAGEAGRDARLLGLHDQRRRDARCGRGERPPRAPARRGLAAVRAPARRALPADAAARPRDERLLRQPTGGLTCRCAVSWRDWIRTVEVEPSLYAADFARLGAQIDNLLAAGARIFH